MRVALVQCILLIGIALAVGGPREANAESEVIIEGAILFAKTAPSATVTVRRVAPDGDRG